MKKAPQSYSHRSLFTTGIGQVIIVRYKGGGRVELGVFLVDVFCLGVKNAFYAQCMDSELEDLLERFFNGGDFAEHSGPWGRKLVEGALEYARRLGFAPHPDYKKAARVMGGIDPKECSEIFTFGKDGKPVFVAGPNDGPTRCDRIMQILIKKCGANGFHFIAPFDKYEEEYEDDDEDEDDSEEK